MKRMIYVVATAICLAPVLAQADAYVVADVALQAGPDTEYPSITEIPGGTSVAVQGCIDGWTWCDVVAGGDEGWVPGTYLEEDYDGQRVVVLDYGPRIRIPIVTFSIGTYWDRHYRSRPFYTQRTEWEHRNIHPHAPPRAPAHETRTAPRPTANTVQPAPRTVEPRHDTRPATERAVAQPHAETAVQAKPTATTHQTPERPVQQAQPNTAHVPAPVAHEVTPKPPVTHNQPEPKAQPKVAPKPEPRAVEKKEPPKDDKDKKDGGGR